jgi:ceramide glucosyltransferase
MALQALAALLAAGLALAGVATSLLAARAVRRFMAQPAPPGPALPATVLKPLYGALPGLAEWLGATLGQRHAAPVQVLFGLAAAEDPAAPEARAAMAAHPTVPAALVVDATRHGANAKVGNLLNLMPRVVHGVVVVADADMRVPPHWLTTVTATLARPGVGLVTCLYRATPAVPGVWARLAALGIDWHFLPNAALGESLGKAQGCYGATMALRTETLAALGGFEALRDLLADDHALGAAVRRLGLGVAVAPVLPEHMMDERSFGALWAHELRWARTVRSLNPGGYWGLALTHPLPWALAAALLHPAGLAVLGLALAARLGLAWSVDQALGISATLGRLLLLPLRDALSFAIWAAGLARGTVLWQGQRYRMRRDGSMEPA